MSTHAQSKSPDDRMYRNQERRLGVGVAIGLLAVGGLFAAHKPIQDALANFKNRHDAVAYDNKEQEAFSVLNLNEKIRKEGPGAAAARTDMYSPSFYTPHSVDGFKTPLEMAQSISNHHVSEVAAEITAQVGGRNSFGNGDVTTVDIPKDQENTSQ